VGTASGNITLDSSLNVRELEAVDAVADLVGRSAVIVKV